MQGAERGVSADSARSLRDKTERDINACFTKTQLNVVVLDNKRSVCMN